MHPLAKLSADQAALMREQLNSGQLSLRAAGRKFGVSPTTAREVRDGLAHSTKDY